MRNADIAAGLHIIVVDDCYEIAGHDPLIGPYDTKREAENVMAGVKRFYRSLPDEPVPTLEDILL